MSKLYFYNEVENNLVEITDEEAKALGEPDAEVSVRDAEGRTVEVEKYWGVNPGFNPYC